MKFIKTYENFLSDVEIPPVDIDVQSDENDDNNEFHYDYKITGMRFSIKSESSIKSEVDILNYNYNGKLNKYQINNGYVCFDVKSYYYGKEHEMLNMDVYYSSDIKIPQGRLKINDLIPEISRIIYENIERPFKYNGNLGYEFWDKQAWLSI